MIGLANAVELVTGGETIDPRTAALMGLAFVLSLCSTSDAFIAATLDKFTYGAKLAWLQWDHPDMPWDAARVESAYDDYCAEINP